MLGHRRSSGRALAAALSVGMTIASSNVRSQSTRGGTGATTQIVVRAKPGPALWSVTQGGSELVMLGAVTPVPQNGSWNTRLLAQALQGARLLLLSPGSTPGLAWAEHFPDSQRYRLGQPLGRTLALEVGPDATARFDMMAAAIGRPTSQYNHYRPGPAGMLLLEDSWRARGLSGARLDDEVVDLAKSAHVRTVRVDEGGTLPLIDAMPSMSRAQHAACLDQAMDQFDREGANAGAVFEAWAQGDLAALRGVYSPVDLCLDSIPGGVRRRTAARVVWLKALKGALATPGRTVVVMDVSDLLEPSELLAALRTGGATVTSPRDALASEKESTLVDADLTGFVDPAPDDLRRAAPDLLPKLHTPVTTDTSAGRAVRLSTAGLVCIQEASTGSMVLHDTCRTRSEWTRIQNRRSLDQMSNFKRGKVTPDPE